MDNKINELLNKQINHEFYSAYLYFAMSTYFSEITMDGFAKYMMQQAKEELSHAQRIYDYLLLCNEKISLQRIEMPENDWVNAKDVFEAALNHEIAVSNAIREIYTFALDLKDFAAMNFLNWFIDEQLEEEEKFRKIVDKINTFDDCNCTIEQLNREFFDKN